MTHPTLISPAIRDHKPVSYAQAMIRRDVARLALPESEALRLIEWLAVYAGERKPKGY